MNDHGRDHAAERDVRTPRPETGGTPTDAGKTMGGGSLGHAPTKDVADEAPLRNNTDDRDNDAVMPSDDAKTGTKS